MKTAMLEKMKTSSLLVLFTLIVSGVFALSSYTESGDIALDTVVPVLQLNSPNGGETWYIGDSKNITWAVSDPNLVPDSASLWYSLNGGTIYTLIAQNEVNDGTLPWTIPNVQSQNTKVKISASDSFGNIAITNSASAFTIAYVPPASPEGISVDISSGVDATISWNAVTNTIPPYNTPITPDGYIVLYNETPYEDERLYYFLGRSYITSYTHHDVAEFRSQMFYKVVAYKNYSRDEELALETLCQTKTPILWQNALSQIQSGGQK
ncbi:MAG: hypothetical protein RBS43_01460 [Candidatus Cloacimonas sp.]|jgi:hypothetical protein|nr:hypothetical protein [Candidatus Cloacimonas sp.]